MDTTRLPPELVSSRLFLNCLLAQYDQTTGRYKTKLPVNAHRQPMHGWQAVGKKHRRLLSTILEENTTKPAEEGTAYAPTILLSSDIEYICIDLDGILENDQIYTNILAQFPEIKDTYTERSISGTGLHILLRIDPQDRQMLMQVLGKGREVPPQSKVIKFKQTKQAVEFYFGNKHIVFSGKPVTQSTTINTISYYAIIECMEAIEQVEQIVDNIDNTDKVAQIAQIKRQPMKKNFKFERFKRKWPRCDTLRDVRKMFLAKIAQDSPADDYNKEWTVGMIAFAVEGIQYYGGTELAFFKECARIFSAKSPKYNERDFEAKWDEVVRNVEEKNLPLAEQVTVATLRQRLVDNILPEPEAKQYPHDPDFLFFCSLGGRKKHTAIDMMRSVMDSGMSLSYYDLKAMIKSKYNRTIQIQTLKQHILELTKQGEVCRLIYERVAYFKLVKTLPVIYTQSVETTTEQTTKATFNVPVYTPVVYKKDKLDSLETSNEWAEPFNFES